MARCQRVNIRRQYLDYDVRCFDLRIRFDKDGKLQVAHGYMAYRVTASELDADLQWISQKGDCYVRVLHEVRTARQHSELSTRKFVWWCKEAVTKYPGIEFWCGRNLYDWTFDYNFGIEPICVEKYSSVCKPRLIDDWWPWLYARMHNAEIIREFNREKQWQKGTILLIDYVNIGKPKTGKSA